MDQLPISVCSLGYEPNMALQIRATLKLAYNQGLRMVKCRSSAQIRDISRIYSKLDNP
jgi:hypothetical protein